MSEIKKTDDGGLAFPGTRCEQVGTVADFGFSDDESPTYGDVYHSGMSKREWFAGQALQGMLSHSTRYRPRDGAPKNWHEAICEESYEIADAMLAVSKGDAA